jgi:hypothetical protein
MQYDPFSIRLLYKVNESEGKSGKKVLEAISGMIYTKREVRRWKDGTDESDVYDVRGKTVRLARVYTIHVGVNKCVHRGKLMREIERDGMGEEENQAYTCSWPCKLVHKLPDTV